MKKPEKSRGPVTAVILEDWRYRQLDVSKVQLEVGRLVNVDDSLRLYGRTVGHPTNRDGKYLYASPVVEFDPASRKVTTSSGSVYRLGTCGGAEDEHLKHLQRDLLRNRKIAPSQTSKKHGKPRETGPKIPTPVANDTIINLDIDSDEDHAFGRVFGHDHDDRHIDAIIEKEMAALEEPHASFVDEDHVMKLPDRPVYDAEPVDPE